MRVLALSGGAAFGAYQVGAWRALSEAGWKPDVIVGISIGAVNGYVLARGVGVEEVEGLWLEEAGQVVERGGWFESKRFRAWVGLIEGRYSARPLVCGYRAVAMGLPGLGTRVMGEVGAAELLGACALPGVLSPVRVDGGWLMDCGVVRHLPLREAVEAGGTEIVCVDLMAHHPVVGARWLKGVLLGAYGRLFGEDVEDRSGVKVVRIEHDRVLGSAFEAFRWSRGFTERMIEAGYKDARRVLSRRLEFYNRRVFK